MNRWKGAIAIGLGLLLAIAIATVIFAPGFILGGRAPRAALAGRDSITLMKVLHRGGDAQDVTDIKTIDRVYAISHQINTSWRRHWHTMPSPLHTFSFVSDNGYEFTLWIGTNWVSIGGPDEGNPGEHTMRIKSIDQLDPSDLEFLRELSD